MQILYEKLNLILKKPSGTSRGILTEKETFIIKITRNESTFFGETGLFRGLSHDDVENYEEILKSTCENFDASNENWWEELREFPSIQFGLEQALKASEKPENHNSYSPILFESEFTKGKVGIPINGLIWMGDLEFMKDQIKDKLEDNFKCIKLKIGVNWKEEREILKQLRNEFSSQDLELRVDANGAFSFEEAKIVLNELAELEIHSIEQPIKSKQIDNMAELCQITPTPIALDEELIGVTQLNKKIELLQKIKPQYIILKPSLIGGWKGSHEWIDAAEELNIGWWITSALEGNIGLNAIAQWTFTLENPMPQGLGTGSLFKNNFESKLKTIGDKLFYV